MDPRLRCVAILVPLHSKIKAISVGQIRIVLRLCCVVILVPSQSEIKAILVVSEQSWTDAMLCRSPRSITKRDQSVLCWIWAEFDRGYTSYCVVVLIPSQSEIKSILVGSDASWIMIYLTLIFHIDSVLWVFVKAFALIFKTETRTLAGVFFSLWSM